jgi:DNA-binding IscR family transcriptional regulator
VRLAVDLRDVTLLDVIEAISGPVVVDVCQTRKRCATQLRKGYCRLNTAWVGLSLEIRDSLRSVRLVHLVDQHQAA